MSDELKKIPVPTSKDFKLRYIDNVNHKPHLYCVTPKHLTGDHMFLNEATIEEAEKKYGARCGIYVKGDKCHNGFKSGYSRCEIPHSEHTSDKVLFIKALVDKNIKDLNGLEKYLLEIESVLKKLHIDGVAFIAPDKKDE